MLDTKNVTPEFIRGLSYPDFVGLINQWNTPPGSYTTLSKLAAFSRMDEDSHLLEVGCSTGFSSRELSVISHCSGIGFDLSENSIEMANYNKKRYSPEIGISYEIADGYSFKPQDKFTHIMVGGNLTFFSDPEKMLARCIEMLKDGGYLLATPYYGTQPIPQELAQRMHDTLGISLKAFSSFAYKEIMKLYNKFEILYEDRNTLVQETEEELSYYCKSIIARACEIQTVDSQEISTAMYDKLLAIRKLINESRRYQEYCVLVLRYRKSVYPHRYVGLF